MYVTAMNYLFCQDKVFTAKYLGDMQHVVSVMNL